MRLLGLNFTVDLQLRCGHAIVKDGLTVGDVGRSRKPPLTGVFWAVLCIGPGYVVKSGFPLVREADERLKQ